MAELENTLFGLSIQLFVLSSMFGLGLSLTLKQIGEPLHDIVLFLKALAANFILVPLVGLALV